MKKEVETEFQGFLIQVSKAIGMKLSSLFPRDAVEQVCAGVSGENFSGILEGLVFTWSAVGNRTDINERYDDAVTIFLVQMIGPLNRLPLTENVECHKLLHAYLSIFDKLLQHITLRSRFTGLLEQALAA